MADIDGMDMLGYLKVRAWKAKRDQEKKAISTKCGAT